MPKTVPPSDVTRGKVEKCLVDLGYAVTPVANETLLWGLAGQADGRIGIAVGQTLQVQDRVLFQVLREIEPYYKDRLLLLPAEERTQFIWDVRFRLLSMQSPFEGVTDPLSIVSFSDFIFVEDLTRTNIKNCIYSLHRSYMMLSWMLQTILAEEPQADHPQAEPPSAPESEPA
jgi:hypothetical protein